MGGKGTDGRGAGDGCKVWFALNAHQHGAYNEKEATYDDDQVEYDVAAPVSGQGEDKKNIERHALLLP